VNPGDTKADDPATKTLREATGRRVETARLSESDYHGLLASERRRTVLAILDERPGPIDLDELAEAVVTRGRDADTPGERERERTAVELHHAHLPKMDALGVVDYDPDANRVE
jgi:hypothetical protein